MCLGNFDSIQEAITSLKQGKPVVVVDDEDRENEGDLVILILKFIRFYIKIICAIFL